MAAAIANIKIHANKIDISIAIICILTFDNYREIHDLFDKLGMF